MAMVCNWMVLLVLLMVLNGYVVMVRRSGVCGMCTRVTRVLRRTDSVNALVNCCCCSCGRRCCCCCGCRVDMGVMSCVGGCGVVMCLCCLCCCCGCCLLIDHVVMHCGGHAAHSDHTSHAGHATTQTDGHGRHARYARHAGWHARHAGRRRGVHVAGVDAADADGEAAARGGGCGGDGVGHELCARVVFDVVGHAWRRAEDEGRVRCVCAVRDGGGHGLSCTRRGVSGCCGGVAGLGRDVCGGVATGPRRGSRVSRWARGRAGAAGGRSGPRVRARAGGRDAAGGRGGRARGRKWRVLDVGALVVGALVVGARKFSRVDVRSCGRGCGLGLGLGLGLGRGWRRGWRRGRGQGRGRAGRRRRSAAGRARRPVSARSAAAGVRCAMRRARDSTGRVPRWSGGAGGLGCRRARRAGGAKSGGHGRALRVARGARRAKYSLCRRGRMRARVCMACAPARGCHNALRRPRRRRERARAGSRPRPNCEAAPERAPARRVATGATGATGATATRARSRPPACQGAFRSGPRRAPGPAGRVLKLSISGANCFATRSGPRGDRYGGAFALPCKCMPVERRILAHGARNIARVAVRAVLPRLPLPPSRSPRSFASA